MRVRYAEFDWHGQKARAFVPDPITARSLVLTEASIRKTERAVAELRRMDDRLMMGAEPLGRLLLRSEGIASSAIEGLRVPIDDLLTTEALGTGDPTASWVAANLTAVADALNDAGQLLDDSTIHRWHRTLMRDSPLDPDLHGVWRPSPGWIGGTSPLDAVYVPAPASAIPELMEDLIKFVNGDDVDPISQAAIAHAQFETIHPYGDGNGRIGRVLIGWILRRRGAIDRYPPPVSATILQDTGGYLSGLYEFREGDPVRWIEWFAERTAAAAVSAGDLYRRVADLMGAWRGQLHDVRADAIVHRIVDLLPEHILISAPIVVNTCGVSLRTALSGLEVLESRGILSQHAVPSTGIGRPVRWWIAEGLVEALTGHIG